MEDSKRLVGSHSRGALWAVGYGRVLGQTHSSLLIGVSVPRVGQGVQGDRRKGMNSLKRAFEIRHGGLLSGGSPTLCESTRDRARSLTESAGGSGRDSPTPPPPRPAR
eukprot:4083511-Pyramimonas_sp.AAC.1